MKMTAPRSTSDINQAFSIPHLYLHRNGSRIATMRASVCFLHSNPHPAVQELSIIKSIQKHLGRISMYWGTPIMGSVCHGAHAPLHLMAVLNALQGY